MNQAALKRCRLTRTSVSISDGQSVYMLRFKGGFFVTQHGHTRNDESSGMIPGREADGAGIVYPNTYHRMCVTDGGTMIQTIIHEDTASWTSLGCVSPESQMMYSHKAFIRQGILYVMADRFVYICDKKILLNVYEKVSLTKKSYEEFILCRSDLWWVITIVILVILVILLLLTCLLAGAAYVARKYDLVNDRTMRSIYVQHKPEATELGKDGSKKGPVMGVPKTKNKPPNGGKAKPQSNSTNKKKKEMPRKSPSSKRSNRSKKSAVKKAN